MRHKGFYSFGLVFLTEIRVVSFSSAISIFVGENKQPFSVSKELAMIHSPKIRSILGTQGPEDNKVFITDFDPAQFADFMSWMYTGEVVKTPHPLLKRSLIRTWLLAKFLEIPSMQNDCMDALRRSASFSHRQGKWPQTTFIGNIYKICPKGSIPRKFAAHSMVSKNPFLTHKEGSEAYEAWKKFVENCPDLASDIAIAAGKKWENKTFAWDEEYREAYMVKSVDLGKEWESHILRTRSKVDIEKEAKNGCFRSIIELEHLEHLKSRTIVVE